MASGWFDDRGYKRLLLTQMDGLAKCYRERLEWISMSCRVREGVQVSALQPSQTHPVLSHTPEEIYSEWLQE